MAKPKRDRFGRYASKSKARRSRKSKSKSKKSRSRRGMRTVVVVKARANPAAAKRRRRAKLKSNPAAPKRHRRVKHKANPAAAKRRRRNPLSKRFQNRAKRTAAVIRYFKKKSPKRSLRRRALSTQLRRANTIYTLSKSPSPAKKIRPAIRGLQHAMITRSNPGMAGVIASAKILAPQAAVGGVGLIALTLAGKYVADMIVMQDGKVRASFADAANPANVSTLGKYVPALSTAGLSVVGYMVADKVAPRFKGAVMIGGMIGAIVQAVMASIDPAKDSWAKSVQAALLPMPGVPAAAQAGMGEYTTVGSGIFHGMGAYTTVGGGGDNRTEFAADSLRGLDDSSQFAPGEGGVLSGGIFK